MVAIVIGIILIGVGALLIITAELKKQHCTEVTTGKITDIVSETSNSGSKSYNGQNDANNGGYSKNASFYYVVEYTVGENKYIKKSDTGSSSPRFSIGQEVEVHYNPSKPEEYYVNSGVGTIIIGTIFAVIGLVITVSGIMLG